MIAGRHGDDAAFAFVLAERKQFVERAAFFEGGGELQILEFEENLGARDRRQRARMPGRRDFHRAANRPGGRFDVGQRNRKRCVHAWVTRRANFGFKATLVENWALGRRRARLGSTPSFFANPASRRDEKGCIVSPAERPKSPFRHGRRTAMFSHRSRILALVAAGAPLVSVHSVRAEDLAGNVQGMVDNASGQAPPRAYVKRSNPETRLTF